MKHFTRCPLDVDVAYMGVTDLSCNWYNRSSPPSSSSSSSSTAAAAAAITAREADILANSRVKSCESHKLYPLSLVVDSNDVVSMYDYHLRSRLWSSKATDLASSSTLVAHLSLKPNKTLDIATVVRNYVSSAFTATATARNYLRSDQKMPTSLFDLEEELDRMDFGSKEKEGKDITASASSSIDPGPVHRVCFLDSHSLEDSAAFENNNNNINCSSNSSNNSNSISNNKSKDERYDGRSPSSPSSSSLSPSSAMVRVGIICEKGVVIRDNSCSIWIANPVVKGGITSSVTELASISSNLVAIAVAGGDIYILHLPQMSLIKCLALNPDFTVGGAKCDINFMMNVTETRYSFESLSSSNNNNNANISDVLVSDKKIFVFRLLSVYSDGTCLVWEGISVPNLQFDDDQSQQQVNIVVVDNKPIAKLDENLGVGNKLILGHYMNQSGKYESINGSGGSSNNNTNDNNVPLSASMGANSNIFLDSSSNCIVIVSTDKSMRLWCMNVLNTNTSPTTLEFEKLRKHGYVNKSHKEEDNISSSSSSSSGGVGGGVGGGNASKASRRSSMFGFGKSIEDIDGIAYTVACTHKMSISFSSNSKNAIGPAYVSQVAANSVSSVAKIQSDHPLLSAKGGKGFGCTVFAVACHTDTIGIIQRNGTNGATMSASSAASDSGGDFSLLYEISLIPLVKKYIESLSPQECIIQALLPPPAVLNPSDTGKSSSSSNSKAPTYLLNNLKAISCHTHPLYKESIVVMTNVGIVVLGLDYIRSSVIGRHPLWGNKIITHKHPNKLIISEIKTRSASTSSHYCSAAMLAEITLEEHVDDPLIGFQYSNTNPLPTTSTISSTPNSSGAVAAGGTTASITKYLYGSQNAAYSAAVGRAPNCRSDIMVSPSGRFVAICNPATHRYTVCYFNSSTPNSLLEVDQGVAKNFAWIGRSDMFVLISPSVTTVVMIGGGGPKDRRQSIFGSKHDDADIKRHHIDFETPELVVKQIISPSSSLSATESSNSQADEDISSGKNPSSPPSLSSSVFERNAAKLGFLVNNIEIANIEDVLFGGSLKWGHGTNGHGASAEDLLISMQSGVLLCANYHTVKSMHQKAKSGPSTLLLTGEEMQKVYCNYRYPLSSQFSVFYDIVPSATSINAAFEFVQVGPPVLAVRSVSWDYSRLYCATISRDSINILKVVSPQSEGTGSCSYSLVTVDNIPGFLNGLGSSQNSSIMGGCTEIPTIYWQDSMLFVNNSVDSAIVFTGFYMSNSSSGDIGVSYDRSSNNSNSNSGELTTTREYVEVLHLSSEMRLSFDLLSSLSTSTSTCIGDVRPKGMCTVLGVVDSCIVLSNSQATHIYSIPLSTCPSAALLYVLSLTAAAASSTTSCLSSSTRLLPPNSATPSMSVDALRLLLPGIIQLANQGDISPNAKDYISDILRRRGVSNYNI